MFRNEFYKQCFVWVYTIICQNYPPGPHPITTYGFAVLSFPRSHNYCLALNSGTYNELRDNEQNQPATPFSKDEFL